MGMDGAIAARRWDRLILWGWIVAFSLIRAGKVNETDPFWQIRAGQEVLDGSPLARPDTWSWAPVEGLFYPNSPAWNIALAVTWNGLGSWGIFVLAAASMIAYLGMAAHLADRLGAEPLPTTIGLLLIGLLALPTFSARAGIPAQALFLGSVAFAMWWSSRTSSRAWVANAAVVGLAGLLTSFAGNWIHLSWSTWAAATAVAWAVIWLLTATLTPLARTLLIATGTLGLALGVGVGPYGVGVFRHSSDVFIASRDLIVEWTGAFSPQTALSWAFAAIVALALSLGAVIWSWRRWRADGSSDPRVRLAAALGIVALPAAVGGFVAIRFTGMAILTIAPVAAAMVTVAGHRFHARLALRDSSLARRLAEYSSAQFVRVILTATLVVVAPFFVAYAWKPAAPTTPTATAVLPSGCRLFSTPSEAAAVILTRPDVPVWIDGRTDYWGRERLERYYSYLTAVDGEDPLPPGTTCVLLPEPAATPAVAGLVAALDRSPEWRRAAAVDDVVVWVPAELAGVGLS